MDILLGAGALGLVALFSWALSSRITNYVLYAALQLIMVVTFFSVQDILGIQFGATGHVLFGAVMLGGFLGKVTLFYTERYEKNLNAWLRSHRALQGGQGLRQKHQLRARIQALDTAQAEIFDQLRKDATHPGNPQELEEHLSMVDLLTQESQGPLSSHPAHS